MKTVKLSVSSAILVSVLSGCSQQQVGNGPQLGSQQLVGGAQVFSQKATADQSPDDFYESEAHRRERLGLIKSSGSSQQQLGVITSVVEPAKNIYKPKTPKTKVVVRKKPRPTHSVRNNQGLPPAKPGQCFAKVKVPTKYITKTKRILIRKATAKRVLVRAPQYRWVNKRVLVRKASYRNNVIPARYKTITQKKMVKPAYVTWKKGHGAITRIDNMTGEIMCRVKVPAVYKTVKKRVLVRPAQRVRKYIPAVYKTIKQKQRISSAIYKTVKTPARYKTQNYRVKVGSARYVWRSILCKSNAPKNYRQIRNHRKTSIKQYQAKNIASNNNSAISVYTGKYNQSGIQYKHSLKTSNTDSAYYEMQDNKTSATEAVIKSTQSQQALLAKAKTEIKLKKAQRAKKQRQAIEKRRIVYKIQRALKAQGFNPGGIDGKMGPKTAAALGKFQKARGLSVGVLNNSTFNALGMTIRSKEMQIAAR